jgi:GDPmannose 4,6-dehydratase
MKKAIITGISGQDGAYLSELLIKKGYTVYGFTRDIDEDNFWRLTYLGIRDKVKLVKCDLTDFSQITSLIQKILPDEIYNLAAQSSVSLSFKIPKDTLSFNLISVFNILEAIRIVKPDVKFYQASSSEIYGDAQVLPITEKTILNPVSPYAISKASGFWMTKNYREAYNLFSCSGILFNHESYLRSENFFIKKVIRESIAISKGLQEVLKVGNLEVKRDFGSAKHYVEMMYLMLQHKNPDDFLICSGVSIKLSNIIEYVFEYLGISMDKCAIDENLYRPLEIHEIYGDSSKAKKELGWHYDLEFKSVIIELIQEELKNWK